MIQIKVPQGYQNHHQWENQLIDWSVAHNVEFGDVKKPILIEGRDEHQGKEAIDAFFEEYKKFRDDWYACKCDAWTEVID